MTLPSASARPNSLRESEERFHAIFTQAAAGIAQTDLNGRFTLVNKGYCEITGREAKELLGRSVQEITHPGDLAASAILLEKLKKEGTGFVFEKRYLLPNGEIVWVRNSVSMVNHPPGHGAVPPRSDAGYHRTQTD